ncbi:hypothetical protein [Mycobacterium sp. UM_CSW]|uniref:hypothetical protein n=1 Tax=Mycobacterium sp. UM_CSW TaxID=1370119 RepID=UPI000402A6AB|nr:hypothetical protein [Mycobacterium sp. UM_CSW]
MPTSEPGKMDAPITFYNHGKLGDAIGVKVDHDTATVDIFIRGDLRQPVVKRITGQDASWFAHLTLHRHDLTTAKKFLDEFQRLNSSAENATACAALWIAAVAATIKCFDASSAARDELKPDTIFGASTPVRADFKHLKYLRNKHISHDESNWMQCNPLVIIDDLDGTPTINSVHGMVVLGESANADNIGRLRRVIDSALAWVQTEWDDLAEALLTDLRSHSRAELAVLPDVTGALPHEGSVGKNRGKAN